MIKKHLKNSHKDIILLLSLVLRKNSAWILTHDDYQLNENETHKLHILIKKREQGVPFAYLSGTQGFYHLDFKVTPDTLIPRPETELLIDIALDLFQNKPCDLLDLGTGSGIIAVTLADKNPQWKVTATDFSKKALAVAKENSIVKINFQYGYWFEAVTSQTFDFIISNPPYIEENDVHLKHLKYEPITALTAGKQGLDAIKIIIKQAPKHLNNQGYLLLEHGHNQQAMVVALLKENFTHIRTFNDYNFRHRAVLARLL